MLRSAGLRFIIVGILTLVMIIPLFFVESIIDARRDYSRSTAASVGAQWGGPQTLSGPRIVIPVEGPETQKVREEFITDAGEASSRIVEQTLTVRKSPLVIAPDLFEAKLDTTLSERKRGIFSVPVYVADVTLEMRFEIAQSYPSELNSGDRLLWNDAELVLDLTSNKALRGEAALKGGERSFPLEPRIGQPGIRAPLGDPRTLPPLTMKLQMNGAERLYITPVGRQSTVTMTSDWPDPSFDGAFLPNTRDVSESGFTASWSIPHLARSLPQVSRGETDGSGFAFGTRFYQPNDFYQKAYRAARYAILFIGLSFLTVLLLDRTGRPAHPVQYLLIGLAQAVFVLLMVAYAEQVGFGPAYFGASGATIALITLFGWTALKMGVRTLVLGAMLIVLYAVLYLILKSTDYALLAGATLAFIAVAGTMIATRNEDWYGPDTPAPEEGGSAPSGPKPEPKPAKSQPAKGGGFLFRDRTPEASPLGDDTLIASGGDDTAPKA